MSGDGPVTGQRSSGLGAGPPATEAHREGLVEGLLEYFGPNVHAASVVKIIEVAQTDIPVAEANLHHPFAVPPIPCDTGKVRPIGLRHGCTSHEAVERTWKQGSCVSARAAYLRRAELITHSNAGEGIGGDRHRRRWKRLNGHAKPFRRPVSRLPPSAGGGWR